MFGLTSHLVIALSYAAGPNKHNFKRARPPHIGQNDCTADRPRRSLCWTGAKRTESSSRTPNRPTTPGNEEFCLPVGGANRAAFWRSLLTPQYADIEGLYRFAFLLRNSLKGRGLVGESCMQSHFCTVGKAKELLCIGFMPNGDPTSMEVVL